MDLFLTGLVLVGAALGTPPFWKLASKKVAGRFTLLMCLVCVAIAIGLFLICQWLQQPWAAYLAAAMYGFLAVVFLLNATEVLMRGARAQPNNGPAPKQSPEPPERSE